LSPNTSRPIALASSRLLVRSILSQSNSQKRA
jgi:hypothetical protein